MHWMFFAGLIGLAAFLIITWAGLDNTPVYDAISGFGLGVATGMIVIGVIFTGRNANKIREFKQRLLKREK